MVDAKTSGASEVASDAESDVFPTSFEALQTKVTESLSAFQEAKKSAERIIVSTKVDESNKLEFPPDDGLDAYIALKKSSRIAFKAAYLLRELQKSDETKLDDLALELQNLNYRKRRLMEEVERSRCFESSEVNQIAAAGGVGLNIDDTIIDDTEHKARLEALNAELADRSHKATALASARNHLEGRMAYLETLKDSVRELPLRLQAVRRAAQPLANTLSVVNTSTPIQLDDTNHDTTETNLPLQSFTGIKRKRLDDIDAVPTPLYLLYRQLEAAAETNAISESVSCELETTGETPVVILSTPSAPERVVKFYYIPPPIDCILVGVLDLAAPNDRSELDAALDLSLLFAGDDGTQLPPDASHRLLASGYQEETPLRGRPFEWAQWLAGREARAAKSSRLVLARIVDRLQAHKALESQLQGLQRRPPHLALHKHCPLGLKEAWTHHTALAAQSRATLTSWSELPHEDVNTENKKEYISTFAAEFSHHRTKLKVLIQIPAAYPYVPPKFILGDPARQHVFRALYDLQRLVNADLHNIIDLHHDQARYWLLSHQLAALLIAFDHVAKRAVGGSSSTITTGDFLGTRYRRGKDRRRPLIFDPVLNVYTHSHSE